MRNHAYQEQSIHIPLKQIIRKTRLYLKWHKRNRNINYIKRHKQRRDTNQNGISASADKHQICKGLAHQCTIGIIHSHDLAILGFSSCYLQDSIVRTHPINFSTSHGEFSKQPLGPSSGFNRTKPWRDRVSRPKRERKVVQWETSRLKRSKTKERETEGNSRVEAERKRSESTTGVEA